MVVLQCLVMCSTTWHQCCCQPFTPRATQPQGRVRDPLPNAVHAGVPFESALKTARWQFMVYGVFASLTPFGFTVRRGSVVWARCRALEQQHCGSELPWMALSPVTAQHAQGRLR